jgi:hypothetical protein
VWFTALFPYVVMISILWRAITLEGAGEGLLLYVTPDWSKLFTSECWIDSATQIFFAYSIGEQGSTERDRFFASGSFHKSSFPKPLKIMLGSFRFFSKIGGDIRESRYTTGIENFRKNSKQP